MHCNYHTHTYRCHHAVGEERAYIEAAIRGGITAMGFSDHVPLTFPDGYRSDYRIDAEADEEYMQTLRALREEYRADIRLYIGFEMEYYPRFFNAMLHRVRELGAEYLLLGQHFIRNELPPHGRYAGIPDSDPAFLTAYVDEVIEGLQTGVFTYLAHPDLCRFTGDPAHYEREMRRLCRAAHDADIPLEINLLGIRDKRWYPTDRFWRIAGEEGNAVVLGCDAHDPAAAYDAASLPAARRLIAAYGLTEVEPRLIIP